MKVKFFNINDSQKKDDNGYYCRVNMDDVADDINDWLRENQVTMIDLKMGIEYITVLYDDKVIRCDSSK